MAKQPAKRATVAEPESDEEAAADLPEAKVVSEEDREDPLRMVKLGGFAFVLIAGWAFLMACCSSLPSRLICGRFAARMVCSWV